MATALQMGHLQSGVHVVHCSDTRPPLDAHKATQSCCCSEEPQATSVQKTELPAVSIQLHCSKLPPPGGIQTSFMQAPSQQNPGEPRQEPPADWHSAQVLLLVSQMLNPQHSLSAVQEPPFGWHIGVVEVVLVEVLVVVVGL
jgi:hypothetical protein